MQENKYYSYMADIQLAIVAINGQLQGWIQGRVIGVLRCPFPNIQNNFDEVASCNFVSQAKSEIYLNLGVIAIAS